MHGEKNDRGGGGWKSPPPPPMGLGLKDDAATLTGWMLFHFGIKNIHSTAQDISGIVVNEFPS